MERDVDKTKARILAATARLLAKKGFAALGPTAIADAAQVGKPLVYRYFGGLDGLLAALGHTEDFWPSAKELLDGEPEPTSYGAYLRRVLLRYLRSLLRRPLTREVLAWELVEHNALTRALDAARARSGRAVVAHVRERAEPPPGVDAPAINALLLAAIHHLVTRTRLTPEFAGMRLETEDDWSRLETALEQILTRVYG
jgi:AcrR family transcriptional regulator